MGDSQKSRQHVKKRPPLLRALGSAEPPETIAVAGREWRLDETFKHDSWAATATYVSGEDRLICKFNRTQPIFFLPMRWLGRMLARRELGFLERLRDVELVPTPYAEVRADGVVLDNAAARVFIPGEAFHGPEQVTPTFFDDLYALLREVHARDMAYVDLHKRENVIVGPGGRPHLIDFQVSFGVAPGAGRVKRAILKRLQETDLYHIRKHHIRCFPETLTPEQIAAWRDPPGIISIHRRITKPLRSLRRKLLVTLGVRDASGMARSEADPEIAFRERNGANGPKA
ncbi:MAG: hypothetical protein EA385_14615 [Salinarimonadaceae bacterium]|nr:MAG: hypothetical protein EA385_14615 [Salinarimonadaceae bacterium]